MDEATLQELLFRHADILPLGEIDPAYEKAVPVCMELSTRAGPADALYLTPTGKIILAEFKLWRNPGARRKVIGQILDYASELASWSYDDLEREVRNRTKKSPFEIVSEGHSSLQQHIFVDRVARNLKRGEFLLLIIGDGIREGVEEIVHYVQKHSGLRFNLALVEAAVFRRRDGEDLIIQPRVLARTELARQGRPRLGYWRKAEFSDAGEIGDFDESVEWMREHFNRLVSKLHPECRRRLRATR